MEFEHEYPWQKLTRQYLALRKKEFLQQAIQAADGAGEKEIAALLRAFEAQDFQTVIGRATELHPRLLEAGRGEEGWTVALIALDPYTRLAEQFMHLPEEAQAAGLEQGIQACQQAVAIARSLDDAACQAFYEVAAGNGYLGGRRLEEAEGAYREAEALRRPLAEANPPVYTPDLARTLNNWGTALSDLRQLEEAEEAYLEAKSLCEHSDVPDQFSLTLSNLGLLWMIQERWQEAAEVLDEAVEQVERLRAEALSLDRRMQVLRENIHIYERLLIALMKLGQYQKALEVAERGKSRTLIDLLTLRDLRPRNAPPKVVAEYERMLFRARCHYQVNTPHLYRTKTPQLVGGG